MINHNVLCSQCGEQASIYFSAKDYNRKISSEKFHYYRCRSCSFVFLFPIPINLKEYYPDEYHLMPSSEKEFCNLDLEQEKIELIQTMIPKGHILEIGPSVGGFLHVAKKAGFDVQAIEMDERCCQFIQKQLQIPVIQSDDPIAALGKAPQCDVIAMWHVIEHLPDPWTTLEAISKKLPTGGFLAIAAPNPNALQFQLLRRYWAHVDAPRHLGLIPLKLLTKRLETLGMSLRLVTTNDLCAKTLNLFGWQRSLANFSDYFWMKKALTFSGRIISKFLHGLESQNYWGSTYTAIFEKKS